MSLLFFLKPHYLRTGRGQQLVIQKAGAGEYEEKKHTEIIELATELQLTPELKALADQPFFAKEPEKLVEFRKMYKQAKAEGISMEDMLLLYMMTER